jgi:hypothetical protein
MSTENENKQVNDLPAHDGTGYILDLGDIEITKEQIEKTRMESMPPVVACKDGPCAAPECVSDGVCKGTSYVTPGSTGINPNEIPSAVIEAYRRSRVAYSPGDIEDTTALVNGDISTLQEQNEPLPTRESLVDNLVEFIREMDAVGEPTRGAPGSFDNPISLDPNTEAEMKANKGGALDILGDGIADRKQAFDDYKAKIATIMKSKRYRAAEIVVVLPLLPLLLLAIVSAGVSIFVQKVSEVYVGLVSKVLAKVFFPRAPSGVLKLSKEQVAKINETFRRIEESQK